ncbi:MAG: filamentous hemagglutinin N-terminal domain-containing protein [Cyanobacteria bacterium P01_F01_bin.56]
MYLPAPWCRGLVFPLVIGGAACSWVNPAAAQITPDDTLGTENSMVNPVAPQTDLIEGGALRGDMLFHSFEEFNINAGWAANFANPAEVTDILSRVTGANASELFGTLGVLGEANLFFINPNGVVFGPDAQLNISGSFTVSTANSLILPDGSEFSATNPQAPPLLAVEVEAPIGVRFDEELAATLSNEAVLEVGQDLTLSAGEVISEGVLQAPEGHVLVESVAGDVQVQELVAQSAVLEASENLVLEESQLQTMGDMSLLAEDTVRVRDSEENLFHAISGENLLIQGNEQVDILALNHLEFTPFQSSQDLTLASGGNVSGDAHFYSLGNFSVVDLESGAGEFVSLYDPIITANGNVSFGNYRGVALMVQTSGGITGGNIEITGPDTTLTTDGSQDLNDLTTSPALILRAGLPFSSLVNPSINTNPPPDEDSPADSFACLGQCTAPEPPINFVTAGNTKFEIGGGGDISVNSIDTSPGGRGPVILESKAPSGNIFVNGTTASPLNSTLNSTLSIVASRVSINTPGVVRIKGGTSVRRDVAESAGSIEIGSDADAPESWPSEIVAGRFSSRNGFVSPSGELAEDINSSGGDISIRTRGELKVTGGFDRENGTGTTKNSVISESEDPNQFAIALEEGYAAITTQSINGNGGKITLVANDGITIPLEVISANSILGLGLTEARQSQESDGGDIYLSSPDGFINVGDISSLTETVSGQAGHVELMAQDTVTTRSISTTSVNGVFVPFAADIDITSELGDINTTGGSLDSSTQGGQAGDIRLKAYGNITTGDISSESSLSSIDLDDQNNPNIGSDDISLISETSYINTVQGSVSASATSGTAGNITLEAPGDITTSDISSQSASGISGSIVVTSLENDIDTTQGTLSTLTETGEVGNIVLKANSSDAVINVGNIDSTTRSRTEQDPTAINLVSEGEVVIKNASINTETQGDVDSADVNIEARNIRILNSDINVRAVNDRTVEDSARSGNVGNVDIESEGLISFDNSSITATVENFGGEAGMTTISANSISLKNGSRITSLTFSKADAGDINIDFTDKFEISGINQAGFSSGVVTSSEDNAVGSGGDITINKDFSRGLMRVADGGFLSARTRSEDPDNKGSGNITVSVNQLELIDGGQFVTSTSGSGDAGRISVDAENSIKISGFESGLASPSRETSRRGGSGFLRESEEENNSLNSPQNIELGLFSTEDKNIEIENRDGSISILEFANIFDARDIPHVSIVSDENSNNDETADYYSIEISTPDSRGIIDIDDGFSFDDTSIETIVSIYYEGEGSPIVSNDGYEVTTRQGYFPPQSPFIIGQIGNPDPGSKTSDQNYPELNENQPNISVVSATVPDPLIGSFPGAESGFKFSEPGTYIIKVERVNLETTPDSLSLPGRENPVMVDEVDSESPVELLDSPSSTNNINDTVANPTYTLHISVDDPALDPTRNFNPVQGLNSGLFAQSEGTSKADNIIVKTAQLLVRNGGQIATSSELGEAGNVLINRSEDPDASIAPASLVELSGENTGLFAQSAVLDDMANIIDSGTAGSVAVNTIELNVLDQAAIEVSSPEGLAGVVDIDANEVNLENQAEIRAVTGAEPEDPDFKSGEIIIDLFGLEPILWLRNNSEINASANNNASGGNVRIQTLDDDGFVIAIPSEDSDIIARANEGAGGRVFFGQESTGARTFVLGLRVRPDDTPLSDIIVSSNLGPSGLVGFSDPISEGFLEIEDELALPSSPNLDEGCQIASSSGPQAEFFNFGLGGSPPNPGELIGGGSILGNWIPFELADSVDEPIDLSDPDTSLAFSGPVFSRIPLIGHCQSD